MNNTIIGVILLIAAVFLIVSILLQSSKSHKLPGTISGGAETFFGKTKGSAIDNILGKLTTVVAVIFCLLVVILYVIQDNSLVSSGSGDQNIDAMFPPETTVDTDADTTVDTDADTTVDTDADTTVDTDAADTDAA